MSDIDATLAERGSRYGDFAGHAEITQSIKDAMVDSRNWINLDDDMKEALEMVAHKIGRVLNGDPSYIDSWTDMIGYPRLVEKRLIAEQAAAKEMMDVKSAIAAGPLTDPFQNAVREAMLRGTSGVKFDAVGSAAMVKSQAAGIPAGIFGGTCTSASIPTKPLNSVSLLDILAMITAVEPKK